MKPEKKVLGIYVQAMASKAKKARFGRYDVVAVNTRGRRQVAIVYWSKNEKS